MESLLIGLFLIVLFLERGATLKKQLLIVCATNPNGIIKYFGAAAVLSLTLSMLPSILLSIYMRYNGFFAYEIFGEQQRAIQILSLNVFFSFLLLSIFLFSTALLWSAKANRVSIILSAIAPILLVTMFVLRAMVTGRYDLVFSIFVFCLIIGGYLCFWVANQFSDKARLWWIPLAVSALFMILPVIFYQYAAEFTESALAQMKVGGIEVVLTEPLAFHENSSKHVVSGILLLRTPEFYYLRPFDEAKRVLKPERVLIIRTEDVALQYVHSLQDQR